MAEAEASLPLFTMPMAECAFFPRENHSATLLMAAGQWSALAKNQAPHAQN